MAAGHHRARPRPRDRTPQLNHFREATCTPATEETHHVRKKKTPTAGDNVNEELRDCARRTPTCADAPRVEQATSTSLDQRQGNIFDVFTTSVFDSAVEGSRAAFARVLDLRAGPGEPLPRVSVDDNRHPRSAALIKVDCPSWMNPVNGPWLRRDPVAERFIKNSICGDIAPSRTFASKFCEWTRGNTARRFPAPLRCGLRDLRKHLRSRAPSASRVDRSLGPADLQAPRVARRAD